MRETQPQTFMLKTTVEPACTGQFSSLFLDYIGQKPELGSFFNVFPSIENFGKLLAERDFDPKQREILVSTLKFQYGGIATMEVAGRQIEALGDPATFTVTTGHQLNLFTGPLYFIYKIISTINLAEKLKLAYPRNHFVPVYWMATEDHDFDEINYFKLDGKKYQWQSEQRGAVGDFRLDEGFRKLMREVEGFAPAFFLEAYRSSKTLSEAVRKYVHHLFGEKGLVILDGNDASLKRALVPVLKEDLGTHTPFRLATEQTGRLEALGYKNQIFPREVNIFYMSNGLRERIEKSGHIYKVLNTDIRFTEEQILGEIESHPERFSPNVVLRPIYQEMILPNLAYLGGPAEVAYWLQLKSMFDHFSVPFPAILPRNFALLLDRAIQTKVNQLNLTDTELFEAVEDWKNRFVRQHAAVDYGMVAERAALAEIFEKKGQEASRLDPSLRQAFEAGKTRALKIIDHLSAKVRKAEESRQEIQIHRRVAIQAYLYPGGAPQERVENMMRFFLGQEGILEEMLDLFNPLDFSFMVLRIDEGKGTD